MHQDTNDADTCCSSSEEQHHPQLWDPYEWWKFILFYARHQRKARGIMMRILAALLGFVGREHRVGEA